jgi:heme-degrading monooxygenase HmoA
VHVSVTRTKGSPDQPLELATFAGEAMLPWLRQIQGFEGLLMLSNEAEGTTLVLSFWASREVAEEHREARMQVRQRVTSTVDVQIQDVVGYEVSFAHIESPIHEPGSEPTSRE